MTSGLALTFWGVRGSIPTPVARNLRYGGNTACLTIRAAGHPPLIFDAGSGIRDLGDTFTEEDQILLFLTHFHWDHIQGLPAFSALRRTTIHSAADPATLERTLASQMQPPYYPVPMPTGLSYKKAEPSGTRIGNLLIRPFALHHPNGATGYRVESPSGSIVYASDHEHGNATADETLREYSRDADILVYDAQYTPEEYERRRGWGHSTWREAVALAASANVKQLILFHHDPSRTDDQMDAIVEQARAEFPNTAAAREGMTY